METVPRPKQCRVCQRGFVEDPMFPRVYCGARCRSYWSEVDAIASHRAESAAASRSFRSAMTRPAIL